MAAVPADDLRAVAFGMDQPGRGAQGRTDGDPYRTDRVFGGAARGACDPCRGDSVVCICQMTDAFGHLAYDLFADGAVAGYRIAADVYEVLLGIEAVSHYAAFEIGRGTRHGREACRDGTARAAFRRGKGLDAVGQEFMHPLLGLLTHAGCEGEECTDG